jgi:hypothetical protein
VTVTVLGVKGNQVRSESTHRRAFASIANRCENAIRPFVVGRKGWLFSDTVKGAIASANLYSLVETAKANGVEPFSYLSWRFERLPHLKTVVDFESVLPWHAPTPLGA